ncbi:MAG: pyrroline-5-carboxylate reductase [Lachnospiraceae bacterium]|nr:pyrroline-5-carboxylate reductase [Lachnospiraceae bacterium]
MKIGFIGLGNMASAMIGGILKKKLYSEKNLIGSDKMEASFLAAGKRFGIETTGDNLKVAEVSDILILSVKPQFFSEVIEQIKNAVRKETLIISIAPGKTMEWIKNQFGKDLKLVRCMPNTPALVGEGCTGFCCNELVLEEEQELAKEILESFGKAYQVPESLMDTVVGISGSSPAYVFLFMEAMADEAVAEGMPRALAYEFAAQAVLGSAKMMLETKKHPGELKDMVCSPGGTTIQAVKVLEEKGFRASIMDAVEACIDKSRKI